MLRAPVLRIPTQHEEQRRMYGGGGGERRVHGCDPNETPRTHTNLYPDHILR